MLFIWNTIQPICKSLPRYSIHVFVGGSVFISGKPPTRMINKTHMFLKSTDSIIFNFFLLQAEVLHELENCHVHVVLLVLVHFLRFLRQVEPSCDCTTYVKSPKIFLIWESIFHQLCVQNTRFVPFSGTVDLALFFIVFLNIFPRVGSHYLLLSCSALVTQCVFFSWTSILLDFVRVFLCS